MKLSIIVPVYNEEKTINSILDLVERELNKLNLISSYELVIIDDNSSDNSRAILEERVKEKENHIFLIGII